MFEGAPETIVFKVSCVIIHWRRFLCTWNTKSYVNVLSTYRLMGCPPVLGQSWTREVNNPLTNGWATHPHYMLMQSKRVRIRETRWTTHEPTFKAKDGQPMNSWAYIDISTYAGFREFCFVIQPKCKVNWEIHAMSERMQWTIRSLENWQDLLVGVMNAFWRHEWTKILDCSRVPNQNCTNIQNLKKLCDMSELTSPS